MEVVLALVLTWMHGCAGQVEERQLETAKSVAESVKAAAERATGDTDEKASRDLEVRDLKVTPFTNTPVTQSESEPAAAPKQHSTSPR